MKLPLGLLLLLPGLALAQPGGAVGEGGAGGPPRSPRVEVLTSDERSDEYASALDVVVVGDGYLAGEQALFLEDAGKLARHVRVDRTAKPIRDGQDINFHFAFVSSRERGVSWRSGPARDTAFRSHIDAQGDLVSDDAAADAAAAELAPDVDLVVILIRLTPEDTPATPRERLRAHRARKAVELPASPDDVRPNADTPDQGKRVRIPSTDTEAFLHEVGHALYNLSDEYEELEGAPPEDERWEIAVCPNLSLEETGARWRRVVDSAFEGGGYYAEGVWRPEEDCRMRASRSELFCAVCEDVIRGAAKVSRVPAAPAWKSPVQGQRVDVERGAPLALDARWTHTDQGRRTTSYRVELQRVSAGGSRRTVFEDHAEDHRRAMRVEAAIRESGTYRLGVAAVNLAGESEMTWLTFTARVVAPSPGLAGSVEEQ